MGDRKAASGEDLFAGGKFAEKHKVSCVCQEAVPVGCSPVWTQQYAGTQGSQFPRVELAGAPQRPWPARGQHLTFPTDLLLR